MPTDTTATITIDAAVFAQLRAAAEARGEDPNHYATTLLSSALQEEQDPDADLTEEERSAIREGVQRGLQAFEEGNYRSLEDVVADKRARFGLKV